MADEIEHTLDEHEAEACSLCVARIAVDKAEGRA
jgi:hypothetical protein